MRFSLKVYKIFNIVNKKFYDQYILRFSKVQNKLIYSSIWCKNYIINIRIIIARIIIEKC